MNEQYWHWKVIISKSSVLSSAEGCMTGMHACMTQSRDLESGNGCVSLGQDVSLVTKQISDVVDFVLDHGGALE